jgi:hypothetical protein
MGKEDGMGEVTDIPNTRCDVSISFQLPGMKAMEPPPPLFRKGNREEIKAVK